MSDSTDSLREEYTIDTPENVTFGYEIAGIGNRFIAALVDTFLLGLALVLLNFILGVVLTLVAGTNALLLDADVGDIGWAAGLVLALYTLLNFGLIWGYYILFEWLWNGQTPGKRMANVRVVRLDGNPAGFFEIAVRNLVRIVDFLPGAYAIGVITMFFNAQARRLGDFAAGTLVIKERTALSLESLGQPPIRGSVRLSTAAPPDPSLLLAAFPTLRRLSAADIDLVQDALSRYSAGTADVALLRRIATVMAAKVGAPDPASDWRQFLNDLLAAYQRTG